MRTHDTVDTAKLRILIAGGGTGGHVFPGIAIANEVRSRYPEAQLCFVGTEQGIEKKIVPSHQFTLKTITVSGIKGIRGLKLLKALWAIPRSLWESLCILREFRPHLVIGVGGYSSGPPVLMAAIQRIPTLIQEQNARPGITNRLLSRVVGKVAIAFDESRTFFGRKAVLTGNPVRTGFAPMSTDRRPDRFTLLVFGGSQGSQAINRAVMDSLGFLKERLADLWFIHQAGERECESVQKAYQAAGAAGEIRPFFHDMPLQFSRADLIICRSGAMTLAELTVAGKAAILVPFPSATDNHQQKNAEALVSKGGAEMILQPDLSGKRLAERIIFFFEHREDLHQMEQTSREMGHPDAAKRIVDLAEKLIHV
jgi:UDP-N-acetylglucosamine--N-acetylmuramyl-(pentapeptide) pyrophosphoryl-undecaprenol N-acetylglucosamine transferase